MWPNYIGGFPSCCKHFEVSSAGVPEDLKAEARTEWVDPTIAANDGCGFCSMWAHESMKHGTCLATDIAGYFRGVLGLLDRLRAQTKAANELLSSAANVPVETAKLEQIFAPYGVQVMCDPRDGRATSQTGVFLELRTCWNRTAEFEPGNVQASDFIQIGCPGEPVGSACPESFMTAVSSEHGAKALSV